MEITFWFDPGCPWCWIASRWMTDVAPQREAVVELQPFSLLLKNVDADVPEEYREAQRAGHRALRVIAAAEEQHGQEAVARLYTAFGARIHHDGDRQLAGMTDALVDARLPSELAGAADDASYDEILLLSMKEALSAAGDDVGVPLIRFGSAPAPAFFGPVITPRPVGDAALALFDGMSLVAEASAASGGGFYELKRTRDRRPDVGSRPELS